MISKKEGSKWINDFRPISVINIIPKLIAKVLANRLRESMLGLISLNQTAFIQGRQITENFVTTRETLQHLSASKKAVVFLKIDFAKAFDSIEWSFLFKIIEARGFSQKWMGWIKELFSSTPSRVIINGEESNYFMHMREGFATRRSSLANAIQPSSWRVPTNGDSVQ